MIEYKFSGVSQSFKFLFQQGDTPSVMLNQEQCPSNRGTLLPKLFIATEDKPMRAARLVRCGKKTALSMYFKIALLSHQEPPLLSRVDLIAKRANREAPKIAESRQNRKVLNEFPNRSKTCQDTRGQSVQWDSWHL
jgi:hypothetical protein